MSSQMAFIAVKVAYVGTSYCVSLHIAKLFHMGSVSLLVKVYSVTTVWLLYKRN
jgi:hypothetical protein